MEKRLTSLDVFRGMTIAAMVLVNNPGSWSTIFPPFKHAEWHGWTPTDLIFPFFLFIVGVATSFSLAKRTERAWLHILRRAAILFLLGLVLNGFPKYELPTLRIPGVLQRIAIVYAITAFLVLKLRPRGQAIVATICLLSYWALVAGDLTKEGNLGARIDRALLGGHLWDQSKTWDPEGILSTLPAVATGLFGALTGYWLRSEREPHEKSAGLFAMGGVGIVLGLAWDLVFPINKALWTSSYVVFTAGMALQVLAFCYWLIDIKGWQAWSKPFVIYGVNPIAAYMLSSLAARLLGVIKVEGMALKAKIYTSLFPTGPWGSLLFALSYVVVWLGLMGILYWRRIILKV